MILWRATVRHLLRHPLQLASAIVGVALGVAVVVAIDLANGSAEQAFRVSSETVAGRATHQLVGGPGGIDEALYRELRVGRGVRPSAPVVEGYATTPARPGLTLQLLGVDPFAEAPFRAYTPAVGGGADLDRFLSRPGAALLTPPAARRLGVQPGGTFIIQAGGRDQRLTLVGLLQPQDEVAARALETMVVVDIATAQELLGLTGRLSRIDLIVPEGEAGATYLAQLKAALPAGVTVVRAAARGSALEQMTEAFRLNLTALSLLALVVGMFIIYNTMTFSVLQRRQLLGALRTLGVTRRQVFLLVAGEALVIGLVGTLLGFLLGTGLATGLLRLVTRTINDLYFVVAVEQLRMTPLALIKGIGLGLGATLLAALAPALEATTTPPRAVLSRSHLETRRRRLVPAAAVAGLLVMLAGAGLLALPGKSIPLGFAGLFALIAGYALLTPAATVVLVAGARPVMGAVAGVLGRMAARAVVASLSRTGVAVAALVIAISATVGVGTMIGSFRLTVARWLDTYLRADIYVTSAGVNTGPGKTPLAPELIGRLAATPGVVYTSLARRVFLPDEEGQTELFILQLSRAGFAGFRFKDAAPDSAWQEFEQGGAVIVTEPYAYRHGLQRGSTLRLRTDRGEREFPVAGVYYDYGSDQGRVTISRATFDRFWDDRSVDSLGIFVAPGADPAVVADRLRERSAGRQQVVVYPNRELYQASLATFDRTFAITGVLRLLAVLVAFVGILNALMAIQIERSRELAVLRATGLTPRQLWGLVAGETGLIGLIAGLLALPLGVLQALVLIHVINRRSFGWTMATEIAPAILLQALALALAAALLAGCWPAARMAATPPALALREE